MTTSGLRTALGAIALFFGSLVISFAFFLWQGEGSISKVTPIILGLGVVFGALNALVTVGLILIYRSGRILNFAQAGFGVAALMLYLLLASASHWNFWLSIVTAIVAAASLSWVIEVFIVRRFSQSPRLVLTVVTIALAQTIGAFTLFMPRVWGFIPDPEDPTGGLAALPAVPPSTPFDRFTFRWNGVIFTGNHVAAVVVAIAAMVGLTIFLRYSRVGVAVRGSAENSDRAELLGINVSNLSSVVWIVAGGMAAVAGILNGMVSQTSVVVAAGQGGGGLAAAIGLTTLLRALAAGVIARMDSVPLAVSAALGIGMLEQSLFVSTQNSNYVDVLLLVVIMATVWFQRSGLGRTDVETSGWEATEEIRGIPHELAHLPQVKIGVRRALWAMGIIVVAWPWLTSPSQTNLGGIYAIYGIIGISLVVLTGWGGQISLGHFGFVAVGAAVGGAAQEHGVPFLFALLLGSLAAGAVAILIGIPALRIRGLFLAVTTMAFSVATATWFLSLDWIPNQVTRPEFLWFDSKTDERTFYYICIAALVAVVFFTQGLRRTRTGRVLIAMRDNERTAQAFGVSLTRVRLTAFAISGAMAGFAGVLLANHQSGVVAETFGPERSIQVFLMAVIGGLGSTYAVLVGAIYLGTTGILITDGPLLLLTGSIGTLIILLFFPSGLGGLAFRVRDAWLRRIAMRNRIFAPSLMGDRLREGQEARVNLAARVDEQGEVPERYELESNIGEQGTSQLTKLWRY